MATNSEKTLDFAPVDYDINAMPPPAPEGEWVARISEVKIQPTAKGKFPMLIVEWTLESTDEEEHMSSLGAVIPDFLVFFPANHKGARMGKLRMRALCEKVGVDFDIVPTKIGSKSDLEEFVNALKETDKVTVWTVVGKDNNNDDRTSIVYSKPGGGLSTATDDEDEEDEKPAAKKSSMRPSSAKGKVVSKSNNKRN
jgi:hypothetical protein